MFFSIAKIQCTASRTIRDKLLTKTKPVIAIKLGLSLCFSQVFCLFFQALFNGRLYHFQRALMTEKIYKSAYSRAPKPKESYGTIETRNFLVSNKSYRK